MPPVERAADTGGRGINTVRGATSAGNAAQDRNTNAAALTDDFRGNDANLVRSIEALIALNDEGALVPHGIGGLARVLLSAAAVRLTSPRAAVPAETERSDGSCEEHDGCPTEKAVLQRFWRIHGGKLPVQGSAPAAPVAEPVCATCNGHGMIGAPSFYAPDEGGAPCPDCAEPVVQAEPVGIVRRPAFNGQDFNVEWLRPPAAGALYEGIARVAPAAQAVAADGASTDETMSLRVALDFADNPRPVHALCAPADTNGELYRALRVLADAYRRAAVSPATATFETVTMPHKWDETGERCVRCGDKDWMGTTCTTMKPQAPDAAEKVYYGGSVEAGHVAFDEPATADVTLPYENALHDLIRKIVPGLDSGDILNDARTAINAVTANTMTDAQIDTAWENIDKRGSSLYEPHAWEIEKRRRFARAIAAATPVSTPATADEQAAIVEQRAKIADSFACGSCGMDGKVAAAICASQAAAPADAREPIYQCRLIKTAGWNDVSRTEFDACATNPARFETRTLFLLPADLGDAREPNQVYVECRQCDSCDHIGINDSHEADAACNSCCWNGPSPAEDKCPGCGDENCMAVACPKCSGRYDLLAEGRFLADEIGVPADAGEAAIWKTTNRAVCVPLTEDRAVADMWLASGFEVIGYVQAQRAQGAQGGKGGDRG